MWVKLSLLEQQLDRKGLRGYRQNYGLSKISCGPSCRPWRSSWTGRELRGYRQNYGSGKISCGSSCRIRKRVGLGDRTDTFHHCCVSGMFIPDPDFCQFRILDKERKREEKRKR
jgi:hypothetical protein